MLGGASDKLFDGHQASYKPFILYPTSITDGFGRICAPPAAPAKYDFNWAVNDAASGNDFGHQESRDGDYTQGSYYVLLPDGRLQRVNYNVQGDSGFVAEVTYEGEARAYSPPQPSYAPPPPSYGGK
ncbi:pro-resilin-like [Oratosquilla oratoria]|uniref:pro-resilin-like n=1 Tax=Oratosquilla oratoria TaxID=337810 RepID=UPI003F76088E